MPLIFVIAVLTVAQAPLAASPAVPIGRATAIAVEANDSTAVAAAVANFHRALSAGDSAAVIALLAPDVRIAESGAIETLDGYRAHHLAADVAYARAVPATQQPIQLIVAGDVAWVTSTSQARGTFNGRAVNSIGAETMVLTRSGADRTRWIIQAIHWSSHRGS